MYDSQSPEPGPPTEPPYSGKRWTNFVIGNLIAIGLCAAIFLLFLYGDFLSGASERLMRSLFDVPVLVVIIASMPLIVGIAIGVAHLQKAMRKRRAERAALARQDPRPPA